MKEKKLRLPRWFTFDSIYKSFNIKNIIGFIIPTVWFYFDRIPKNLSRTACIVITLLIFTFFYLLYVRNKHIDYEKSIAEVLETGYFTNFFEKIALHIWEQKKAKESIIFNFSDRSTVTVKADQIKVEVILPLSRSSLKKTSDEIEIITKQGNIDNFAWVLAQENPDNTITIYEYPRTLTAIPKYLDPKYDYDEEASEFFHKHFIAKFNKDWDNASDKIPSGIFKRRSSVEESQKALSDSVSI